MERAATLPLPAEAPERDELDRLLAHGPTSDLHYADSLSWALKLLPATDAGDRGALAHRLLALLESGRLRGLLDSDGASPAGYAAKAVLELGYPWALHLTPAQLDEARALPGPTGRRATGPAFYASASAAGLGMLPLFISWEMWVSAATTPFAGLFGLLSVGAAAVNLLFVLGRLQRTAAAMFAAAALLACWFAYGLTRNIDSALWVPLAMAWGLTLLATRLPGAPEIHQPLDRTPTGKERPGRWAMRASAFAAGLAVLEVYPCLCIRGDGVTALYLLALLAVIAGNVLFALGVVGRKLLGGFGAAVSAWVWLLIGTDGRFDVSQQLAVAMVCSPFLLSLLATVLPRPLTQRRV